MREDQFFVHEHTDPLACWWGAPSGCKACLEGRGMFAVCVGGGPREGRSDVTAVPLTEQSSVMKGGAHWHIPKPSHIPFDSPGSLSEQDSLGTPKMYVSLSVWLYPAWQQCVQICSLVLSS